jgi:hypothetical protein
MQSRCENGHVYILHDVARSNLPHRQYTSNGSQVTRIFLGNHRVYVQT